MRLVSQGGTATTTYLRAEEGGNDAGVGGQNREGDNTWLMS